MLRSIEGLLIIGLTIGLVIGLITRNTRVGCSALVIVPVSMIGYIAWWQSQHPENIRSTSGLDFIFGPLWPSLGALAGYGIAKWMLNVVDKRRNS